MDRPTWRQGLAAARHPSHWMDSAGMLLVWIRDMATEWEAEEYGLYLAGGAPINAVRAFRRLLEYGLRTSTDRVWRCQVASVSLLLESDSRCREAFRAAWQTVLEQERTRRCRGK